MAGTNQIGDHRFAGFSNPQLATEIELLGSGPGPSSMYRAVDALKVIATSLSETDRVMREELAKIGVEWESQTSEDAQVQMTDAAQYGGGAHDTINTSGQAVSAQGDSFSRSHHGAPAASSLRGDSEMNFSDKFAGYFGHTTDHASEVAATNAARQQAVDTMDNYTRASSANLAAASALPVPPGMTLESQPVQGPGVNGTAGPGLGQGGVQAPPGGGGALPPVGAPPGGGAPGAPIPPGKLVGGAPLVGPSVVPGAGPAAGALRPGLLAMGEAAAIAGAGGAAGAGAAERERLARGGRPGGIAEPTGRAPATSSRPGLNAMAGMPADEVAAARTADRLGAKAKPGASLMGPAVAAGSAREEDDDEHVRKYGVEAEDVFGDERLVIDPVLGQDEDEDDGDSEDRDSEDGDGDGDEK
jgi:hypothetical protein